MTAALPIGLVAVLLVGCSSSEPQQPALVDSAAPAVDSVADTPDTAPACTKLVKPFSTKNAACNACAESKCCAEVNGCLGDTRCDDDYVNCSLACALLPADAGDAGAEAERCLAECATAHPEGKARYDATFDCIDTKCAAECN